MNFHWTSRDQDQYPGRAAIGLRLCTEVIGRCRCRLCDASKFLAIRGPRDTKEWTGILRESPGQRRGWRRSVAEVELTQYGIGQVLSGSFDSVR